MANLDLKSVIVQEELIPSTSGVAFLERKTGQLIVEADKRRFAVTDGSQVSTLARMDREGGVIIDGGTLSATEASSLYAMAQECADVFGFDPDIEWGCVAGALVVFQVRPITVPVQ